MEELEKEIQEENQQEPERPYILNKGLPRFVGNTEFKRLRAVIDEKNALIEKFKAYDEERKAYYKDIQNLVDRLTDEKKALHEENAKLCKTIEKLRKKQEPLFAPELRQLMETGKMTASEYEKFMNLYAFWLQHRNDVMFYKSRLKTGRGSVKDLKGDIQSIKAILMNAGDMELLDRLSERLLSMTAHLDTLQQRLSSGVDDANDN